MGAGASVWLGNQRALSVLYNARVGMIIVDGHTALAARMADMSSDNEMDMEIEAEESPYWEPYDGPLADSPPWEPITNARGGLFEVFDDDWIPGFETESQN